MTKRIAVISDLHLGAGESVLVLGKPTDDASTYWTLDLDTLGALRKAAMGGSDQKLDALVILGDLFDLSLASFEESWQAAKVFFTALQDWTDRIVYVPGNHDFTMWHYLEQDIHVTSRTQANPPRDPRPFRYTVPGILHQGQFANCKPMFLSGLDEELGKNGYTGGFFKGLWQGDGKEFLVAYPNFYVLDDKGQLTLLTHGQYFDGFWNGLGRVVLKAAYDEVALQDKTGKTMTIHEMVQLNYPTSVLNASAIGQAGIFADLARKLHDDFGKENYKRAEKILDRLFVLLRAQVSIAGWLGWLKEWVVKKVLDKIKQHIEEKVFTHDNPIVARFNQEYVLQNQKSIESYVRMSQEEFTAIAPKPSAYRIERLVFGHTHEPSRAGEQEKLIMHQDGHPVVCRNTGGWVLKGNGGFDASVACFDGTQWTMVPVSRLGAGVKCQVGSSFVI